MTINLAQRNNLIQIGELIYVVIISQQNSRSLSALYGSHIKPDHIEQQDKKSNRVAPYKRSKT